VKAQFETPENGCLPYKAKFKNTSLAGQTFTWNFGDGTTSNEIDPTHEYTAPGTYIVTLEAVDPTTCNIEDSAVDTIIVHTSPLAAFSVTPTVPVENAVHTFTNSSSLDAVKFNWLFGDGENLNTVSRSTVTHLYNSTGKFVAKLVAYNQFGCTDTAKANLETIVIPRLDVPNAFTPNGPVEASRIFVRGFAIGKMRFIIYNRLGQKVFETSDRNQGWDGKFNGIVQPMDVYAYTLEVEFTDGTRTTKKGDITLLR
jgi:gliding motility-associated-like protein